MPKRYFKIQLSNGAEIHVYFESASGLIVNYVVKLILRVDNVYHEVIRFDSGHNCPHKDILDRNGRVVKKTWYEFLDNKQALDLAIRDLKDNYDLYIERFERWLKK